MEQNNKSQMDIERELKERKALLKQKIKDINDELKAEIAEINKELAKCSKMKSYNYSRGYYNERYKVDEEYKEKRRQISLNYYYEKKKKNEEEKLNIDISD